jgi:alkylation response protein AidB-like acyl-CoA dehydrogenase
VVKDDPGNSERIEICLPTIRCEMTDTATLPEVPASEFGSKAEDYLRRARELTPLIESESGAIEEGRSLTPKVVEALRDSGLFWMMVPEDLGGGGLGVADGLAVAEQITAADGSTGWVFQAYAWAAGLQAGLLPDSGARRLFAGEKPEILCGTFAPTGRGTLVEGGVRITGRWQFGSGSEHADFVGAGVMVYDESGQPRKNPDGTFDTRFVLVPRDEVTLEGNWDVSGLVGTDSQDYSITDSFVPDDLWISTATSAKAVRSESFLAIGAMGIAVAGHTAIALGLMRRALHEVAKATEGKTRLGYPVPIDDHPVFHYEFAKHEAEYQGARRYAMGAFREAEEMAAADGSITPEAAARLHQAATHAHQVSERVVNFARVWAGTKAFREPSFLARAVRDIGVATQHLQVDPITLVRSAVPLLDSWKTSV